MEEKVELDNFATITSKGVSRTVDMSKIDSVVNTIVGAVDRGDPMRIGKANYEASEIVRTSSMDEEQLRWLADQLISKVAYYGRLWRMSMTRSAYESLGQQLSLRDKALAQDPPVDLWPELDGKYPGGFSVQGQVNPTDSKDQ